MSGKEPVRVLGIIGSPRHVGNTAVLVDEVLAGAAEAGALIEKVMLNELRDIVRQKHRGELGLCLVH